MPTSNETIVCDPKEFIPERVELPLDELGISVIEADWGDSEHELFMIRQERGEIPGDRHPPDRTVTIKLQVKKEGTASLAEAAAKLQMKIGRWQDEGGFVKRVPDISGGFSTPVAFIVYGASISGLDGWLMAHRQVANDVILKLTVGPFCYGTKEVESGEFKASEVRALEWELPKVLGTAPGLIRVRAKNEGTNSWMGAICAIESRDHSSASTAKMMYEAEELTPLGNAAKATRAGASGGESNNVIKTGSLTATWQAVLYSKLVASSEHLTHTGNRRICLRLWDPNGSAAQVRFRLEWRVLGSTNWIVNDEQSTYLVGNFSYIDLGEVRPEIAVLGNQRWECRVTAKTVGENEQEAQMDLLMIIPTEQYAIVQAFIESTAGGPVIWEDTFVQEAGNATGKKAPVGGTYEGFGSATDFKVNEGVLERG